MIDVTPIAIRTFVAIPLCALLLKMSYDDVKTLQVEHLDVILVFCLSFLSSFAIAMVSSPSYILEHAFLTIVGILFAVYLHRKGLGAQDGKVLAALLGFFGLTISMSIFLPLVLINLGMRKLISSRRELHPAFMPDITLVFFMTVTLVQF